MKEIHIRIDERLAEWLTAQAAAHNHSINAEVANILKAERARSRRRKEKDDADHS